MSIVHGSCDGVFETKDTKVKINGARKRRKNIKFDAVGGGMKRSLDIILATVGLVLLSPLFLLVSIAVKLSSSGPVLFGHTRIGYGGETFKCWKFRSMAANGQEILERHFNDFPEDKQEWDANRKLQNDPRVTWFGKILRTYSVDELPQLLNVLLGQMSLVGPRPVVQDELNFYGSNADFYLRTRPGITGLWQTSGRSDVDYSQRVSLDTEYVNNWSHWQDFKIILRTIPAVLSAEGSY